MSDLFTEIILDEAKNPANYGVLANTTFKQIGHNPSCGDTIQVTLQLDDKKEMITDLKWTGEGCSISMATMSLLSTAVIGKSVAATLKLTKADLLKLLDLPEIAPGRLKCLMIGLSAVQDILKTLP